jgi:hypothetical protein
MYSEYLDARRIGDAIRDYGRAARMVFLVSTSDLMKETADNMIDDAIKTIPSVVDAIRRSEEGFAVSHTIFEIDPEDGNRGKYIATIALVASTHERVK